MKDKRILVLNPFLTKRFSKDGRCQTEEGAWLDVFPPVMFPSIAGATREKYKTMLLDCVGLKTPLNFFKEKIESFSPDLTVINTSTSSLPEDMEAGKIVKSLTDSEIAVYGEHVAFDYKHILDEHSFVDYVIRGEAETPVLKILEGEIKNDGICTRDFTGNFWREPDLDALPFPAYDLMPEYRFPLSNERWIFIRSGRGCPYECIFCIVPKFYGNALRLHSPEYMLKQIKWIVKKLKIKLGMFWDDTYTVNKERVIKICNQMIEENLNNEFKWMCTTRTDRIDEELIRKMKAAGCEMIAFGIESGNQTVLDTAKKHLKKEQIVDAIQLTKKYGIKSVGHFILGLPDSNVERDLETIRFAKQVKVDFAQFYSATPFSGSKLHEIVVKNQFINNGDFGTVQKEVLMSYPHYSYTQIGLMRKLAYRNFYFDFNTILSLITYKRFIKNPLNFLRLAEKSQSFFGWAN